MLFDTAKLIEILFEKFEISALPELRGFVDLTVCSDLEIQKLKEHDFAKYMSCYENHVHAYYLEMYLFSKFHSARKLRQKILQ